MRSFLHIQASVFSPPFFSWDIKHKIQQRKKAQHEQHKANKHTFFMGQNHNLDIRTTKSWKRCPCLCTGLHDRVGLSNEKWARLAMQKHPVCAAFWCRIAKQHHGRTTGQIEEEEDDILKKEKPQPAGIFVLLGSSEANPGVILSLVLFIWTGVDESPVWTSTLRAPEQERLGPLPSLCGENATRTHLKIKSCN